MYETVSLATKVLLAADSGFLEETAIDVDSDDSDGDDTVFLQKLRGWRPMPPSFLRTHTHKWTKLLSFHLKNWE